MAAAESLAVSVASQGDGLPGRVSPSQVGTFTSCPLRYYFTHVLGWRERESAATITGVLVHDCLEQLYRLPARDRTATQADLLLRQQAAGRFQQDEYREFSRDPEVANRAIAGVQNLFRVEDPQTVDVTDEGIEATVSAVLNGVSFGGRLDRRTSGPVPRIADYKSGRRPSAPYLQDKLRQLYLYAAADVASGHEVAEVELLYLGGEPCRVRRPVFDAVIAEATNSLVRMRTASEQALDAHSFQARKSRLCDFCSFRRACPLFAASAPAPGSDESNERLGSLGLSRRTPRPQPEPFDGLDDLAEDEA